MRYVFALVLWGLASVAQAVQLAGVELPDRLEYGDKGLLTLNGAGIRKKLFIKVYVGALYLPEKTTDAAKAIEQAGAKRIYMHFLYDKVDKEKITNAWVNGFRGNLNEAEFEAIKPRLESFNAMFEPMQKGDDVELTYWPGEGTRVVVKGREKGKVEGEDFMQALLNVWLGEKPVDKGLKKGMLGM